MTLARDSLLDRGPSPAGFARSGFFILGDPDYLAICPTILESILNVLPALHDSVRMVMLNTSDSSKIGLPEILWQRPESTKRLCAP